MPCVMSMRSSANGRLHVDASSRLVSDDLPFARWPSTAFGATPSTPDARYGRLIPPELLTCQAGRRSILVLSTSPGEPICTHAWRWCGLRRAYCGASHRGHHCVRRACSSPAQLRASADGRIGFRALVLYARAKDYGTIVPSTRTACRQRRQMSQLRHSPPLHRRCIDRHIVTSASTTRLACRPSGLRSAALDSSQRLP
jgi:hypothetical protein